MAAAADAKDLQSKYRVAREYKCHIDQVGQDRSLEEFMQACSVD